MEAIGLWLVDNLTVPGLVVVGLLVVGAPIWYAHRRMTDHQRGCEKGTRELKESIQEARQESKDGDKDIVDRLDTFALEVKGVLGRIEERLDRGGEKIARLDERTKTD